MSYFIAFMSYVLSLKNRVSGDAYFLRRGPVFPLDGGKLKAASDGEGDCCVCLSRLKEEDVMRRLPCGHLFHRECVDRWLAMCRRTCPLCRLSVGGVLEGGMEEQFTEELMIWFSSFHVPGFWKECCWDYHNISSLRNFNFQGIWPVLSIWWAFPRYLYGV